MVGKIVCRTVTAVVAYVRPDNGQLVMVVIHQAIHCPHLEHHLLSPFQLRCNGIIVNETQKLFVNDPSQVDHVLICKEEDGERLVMPLYIHRVTSYFPCRAPTRAEWEDDLNLQVELTSETVTWNPDDEDFARSEALLLDEASANIADESTARGRLVGINQVSSHCCAVDAIGNSIDNFGLALEEKLRVSSSELGQDPAFWLSRWTDDAFPDKTTGGIDDGIEAVIGGLTSTKSSFQHICGGVGGRSYLNSQ